MSTKTFGTAVVRVLENIQQSTSDLDSLHAHRARQFLIDKIEDLQEEEFGFTEAKGAFQTSSGVWQYDPVEKLARPVKRIKRVWYSDSASDDELLPACKEGLPQIDFDELWVESRNDTTGTNDCVEAWAWFERKLCITPRPDGNIFLVCRYILQPVGFSYKYASGAWQYFSGTSTDRARPDTRGVSTSTTMRSYPGLSIDNVEDDTGWLQYAFQLLVAEATRDLYLGPYQAKDPKKSLAQSWIAAALAERATLESNYLRKQGVKRVEPYYGPAG